MLISVGLTIHITQGSDQRKNVELVSRAASRPAWRTDCRRVDPIQPIVAHAYAHTHGAVCCLHACTTITYLKTNSFSSENNEDEAGPEVYLRSVHKERNKEKVVAGRPPGQGQTKEKESGEEGWE